MPGNYGKIGLSVFEIKLKEGLSERIDEFVAYARESYKADPESRQVFTTEEWVKEYKSFSDNKAIQKLAEHYLLEVMPE